MNWNKKGQIWAPGSSEKKHKYGMLPVPIYLESSNVVRVFYGSADIKIDSRIYYVDLDPQNLNQILFDSNKPSLDIGDIGTFDDSGVVPSCVIKKDDELILYTVGFQRCEKVPYMLYAGIATSKDNGLTFVRPHNSPILCRNDFRPTSQGAPCVIYHNGIYKMWHWFSTRWINIDGKLFLDYKIGYAESLDAFNWKMKNITCIEPNFNNGEFAVARPWVIFENNIFKMWYSIRFVQKLYRIGYAESMDGINWVRHDQKVGIDVSENGWDSEMLCYPSLIDINNKRYLFYNGNNNGATGFGFAELIKE